MEKLARRRIIGQQMMLSEVFLQKGCHVPMHAHENEQFACIMSGELRFTIGTAGEGAGGSTKSKPRTINVKAGEVLHLPSNVPHAADAVVDTLVIDLFSPPSATTGIDLPRPRAH